MQRRSPASPRDTGRSMQPSLLIVEDDKALRETLVRSLGAEGFAVRAVASGRELLERVGEATPDALVIDIGLPDADGRAVGRRELIRTAWPHGAIVHDNTLDVYVARLRRKLGALGRRGSITTVHGVGYRLQ